MALILTTHAVEQFMVRHAGHLPFDDAKKELLKLASGGERIGAGKRPGTVVLQVADPPMQLVLLPERGDEVCLTVLPAGASFGDRFGGDISADEVIDAYRRTFDKHSAPIDREYLQNGLDKQARNHAASLAVKVESLKVRNERLTKELDKAKAQIQKLSSATGKTKTVTQPSVTTDTKTRPRLVRHIEKVEYEQGVYRRMLRITLRLLLDRADDEVTGWLNAIREVESGFLSDVFLYPKCKVKP